jgi:hypothetical protein
MPLDLLTPYYMRVPQPKQQLSLDKSALSRALSSFIC